MPLVSPSPKPELLKVSVNTKLALWWSSGTSRTMSTTTAAPTTCHHTEMLFISAIRWLLKMLASVTRIMTRTKSAKVCFSASPPNVSPQPSQR